MHAMTAGETRLSSGEPRRAKLWPGPPPAPLQQRSCSFRSGVRPAQNTAASSATAPPADISNIAKLLLREIPEIHAFEEGARQVCAKPQEEEKPEDSPPHVNMLAGATHRSQSESVTCRLDN